MKDSPSPVAVGQVVDGKYRVERVVGAGGMGVVVAAQHLRLGTTVALKFLLKHAWENREALSRFLREGQALARITSAHVARVMDVGTLEHGQPYLVMEYLEGSDFGAVLKERGTLSITEAADFLLQVCEAVAEAHANGIVHRDLKPSNLFLTRGADGAPLVKVLDFGISKAVAFKPASGGESSDSDATVEPTHNTNTGALVGSPLYMSPEQIRHARRVDERTDIWALGVILYELLCGKPPFMGESLSGTLAAVAADPPMPMSELRPGVPAALEAVILRCLEKSPDKRYQSISGLAQALQPFASQEARAYVPRIVRVLGASSRRASGEGSSGSSDERQTTVPSWEGDTVLQTFTTSLKKRGVWLFVGAVLIVGGGALFIARSRPASQSPVPAATPDAAPEAAAITAQPTVEPVPPPLATATLSSPSAASAPSASPPLTDGGAAVRPTVTPKRTQAGGPAARSTKPPAAPAEPTSDGTEDRK